VRSVFKNDDCGGRGLGLGNLKPVPAALLRDQRDLLPEESLPGGVPVPPPFNVMVIEADPSPFWVAVPGLLLLS